MTLPVDRRQFLRTAAALGRDSACSASSPLSRPKKRNSTPRSCGSTRTSSRWSGCSKKRPATACSKKSAAASRRAFLSRSAGRPVPGRRPQRRAAAERRVQVPRRAGRQLGPPGEPRRARTRSAGCRSSGPSTTSRRPRRRTSRNAAAGGCRRSRNRTCRRPARPRQAFIDAMEKWDAEAADVAIAGLVAHGRRRRSDGVALAVRTARLPLDRPQDHLRGQRPAHARRSSAGNNTPSRCCARWPTP